MNEKEFLNKLNSPKNRFGTFTYAEVCKLFSNNLSIEHQNVFKRFINKFRKVPKSSEEIIENNFNLILQRTNDTHTLSLIKLLLSNKNTIDIVNANIDEVLRKIFSNFLNLKEIYKELDKSRLLENNIDFIIQNNPPIEQFFIITKLLKGKTKQINNKINNALKLRKIELAQFMLKERIDYKKELMKDYSVTLSIIIDELLESEGVDYIDITKIGGGSYSDVYKIGNKVLKVGENRGTYNIPNHRRILQPLTRTNFIDEKNNLVIACIEISDRVKTIPKREQDKEKLYAMYKELRDAGIIWTDVRFDNIGKLVASNIPTLDGQQIDVAPNSVGFNEKV